MRRSLLLTVVALGALAGPLPAQPATASCAGPNLELPRWPVLAGGVEHTVEGRRFVDGCRDTMSCSVGCGGCTYDDPPPRPMEDVALRLRQGGRSWLLDTASAAEDGSVVWTFRLPSGVRPGPARLSGGRAEPVRLTVRGTSGGDPSA